MNTKPSDNETQRGVAELLRRATTKAGVDPPEEYTRSGDDQPAAIAATVVTELSEDEVTQLKSCERAIERGLRSFVEVGVALAKIRDERLYRKRFQTFSRYIEDRFGIKSRRAYQLIEGAEIATELKMCTKVHKAPARETHVRPLAKLEPREREKVWSRVEKRAAQVNAPITQALVEGVVDEQIRRDEKRSQRTTQQPPPSASTKTPEAPPSNRRMAIIDELYRETRPVAASWKMSLIRARIEELHKLCTTD